MQGLKLNSMVKFKLIYKVVGLSLLHQDFNTRNKFWFQYLFSGFETYIINQNSLMNHG